MIKKHKKMLVATFKYNRKIAARPCCDPEGDALPCPAPGRFHYIRYYHCMGSEYKHLLYKEQQKLKYCTPKQETVTKILEEYKVKSLKHVLNINKTLRSLSQRNVPEGGCPALPCPAPGQIQK